MTLRVLTLIPRYWPAMGGAEQHTRALLQHLHPDVDCTVATFCGLDPCETDYAFAFADEMHSDDNGIPVHQIASKGVARAALQGLGRWAPKNRVADRLFRTAAKPPLRGALKAHAAKADIIHAVYNGFTPAAEVASELGKPFVWTPLAHTSLPSGEGWSSAGFRRLYRRADALIAMTPYEQEWLAGMGADPDKTHVAPMAPLLADVSVDPDAFRETFGITEKQIVLFLGRVTEAKGARLLMDAAEQIWAGHPDTAIVIAGPYDQALTQAWLRSDDPRLKICGTLCEINKQAAYEACDLVCVPSAEESLGVVYLEAWTFGKPVVAADIPVLRTVISNNIDGLLVKRRPDKIAAAVSQLLSNPAWAAQMGACGNLKTMQRYNWASTANTLSEVYDRVLSSPG